MWNDLTMQQRADVISMAVKAGMRDMKSIRSFYDETLGSRRSEDEGSTKDSTPGMTGMMKATLATAAHFGNPTARRMTNYDTRSYVWPDEYEDDGIFIMPKTGNVDVGSYDNLVTPQIQDTGKGLTFVNDVWAPENEQRSYSQSLKFNNEEDARYFGEHYKEIAPMMHLYGDRGTTVNQGPYYVKNYPVVNAEDEGLSEYFMNHKDVAGMAIGGGANGIDGPRRIVMNPYSDVLKTDLQKEGLIEIEAVRHTMDENNYKPSFELSEYQKNLQKTVFKDYPYGSNDEAFKQSIISRILVGDADDLQPTPEQEAEAARFIFSNDSTTANQKAFGGHLLGGGGIKKYVGDLEDITYDADNMKFYEKATGKELGDSAILDEVIVNGRSRANDYLTEANDNTSVYNVPHREYNLHLKDRAEQGAREAAIWREEHPNLSAWGEAAASIPLAVASVPLIAGGAEALAGTSAGQAASSALLSLSNLAKGSTIAGAPAWAWADAGLTSAFAAHGVDELSKGNITPEALLEVAPLGQLIKPAFNASKNALVQLKSLYNNYPIRNYNIDSILKSDFYNQVSKQYGKEFADDIAQKLTTKEFRQYLFGDNPRKAYKDANTHLNQMRFIEDVENAGGQLGGSGLLSRTGTVNRNGLMHDLDFFIPGSIADKTSPVLDALSSNPYTSPLTEDSRAFLFGTGMRTPRRPQITMGGPEQGYINVPQERYGVAADMFIRDQMPSESEAVDIVLDAKRQFGRPKDIADIEAFKSYSEDNPVIDLNTGKGQWNPTLFNKGIFTEEGYPTIQLIETYPGSRVKVPATMNYKGEIKGFPQIQLEKPSTAEITAENAASMTSNPIKDNILITPENYRIVSDAQWDEAYSKALDAGDMTEAERLEALHLKLKAPNNKVVDEAGNPLLVYRANRWGNHVPYTVFDKTKGGNYRGFYFGNKDAVVERYGEDNLRSFYLNSEKPFIEPNFNILQSGRESLPNNDGMIYAPEGIRNSDFEVKVFEPEQIKLAGPTYDDAGNIIPLSQRHDFSNPDIRYGLLPFGIGLTGLGLVNEE